MYGLRLRGTNSGTITTYYGVHVTAPTATTAYGIYVAGTTGSVHGGRFQIGTTSLSTARTLGVTSLNASDSVLFLKGASSQTGLYIEIQDGSGASVATLTSTKIFRLYGTTSGYTGFQAAATTTSGDYILPANDGSANQVLTTDGSRTLSWTTPGAASIPRKYTILGGVNGVGGSITSEATLTDVAVQTVGFYAKAAGKVTDIAMMLSSSRTAGTVTAKWLKNGVVQTGTVAISTATDRAITSSLSVTYAAGDDIQLQVVTSSFTPTGADALVTLYFEDT
jgi:hypothetical protein